MRGLSYLAIITAVVLVLLVGCAPPQPTAAPTKPSAPAPATAAPPPSAATSAPAAAAKAIVPTAAPTAVPAPKVKRGGTLVFAAATHPSSMDPLYETIGQHLKEIALFEPLLRFAVTDFQKGTQELVPYLAESWERNSPTTITFKLRKGVKFHDGSDFNAEAAKWSLERMGNRPKSLSKMLAENFASLEVVDPYTLRINYKNASALQLLNLTTATAGTGAVGPGIVSKAYLDKEGEEVFNTKPSGTGPMKFVEWRKDAEISVAKFDGYWKKGADGQPLPFLDGIRSRLILDPAMHVVELKTGSAQVSIVLTPADLASVSKEADLRTIMVHWAPIRYFFGFNQEKEPFGKNLKLRQATQYAIDRPALAKVFGIEAGRPNYWVGWTPGMAGYDEKLPHYNLDLDKATALVKEAGFPNGVDLVLQTETATAHRRVGEAIQAMLAKVGIRAAVNPVEKIAGRQKIKLGEFESQVNTMSPSPDIAHYNRFFTCEGGANWSNYCNRELDKCMFAGENEIDAKKRQEIYAGCQKIVYDDALRGGLFVVDSITVHRKEVNGLGMEGNSVDLGEIWLDK